jgi:Flp pilus assembly protein TadB
MKKIITSSVLFVAACIVFSSCGQMSNFSSVKRQYRNGYYVTTHNNKSVESKMVEVKSSLSENYSRPSLSKKEDVKEVLQENSAQLINQESPATAAVTVAKDKSDNNLKQSVAPRKKAALKSIIKNAAQIKNIVSENKKLNKSRGAGGSLIWLIIVILLVLWLLGMLAGGFGGLLYLLLVIALVLLLLKILGII